MIREAVPGDLVGVAQVHLATRRSAYAGILPESVLEAMTADELEAWWRNHLQMTAEPNRLLVLTGQDDAQVAGFAHVRPGDLLAGELFAIHVHPQAQGAGDGKALLQAALTSLQTFGFERARLWVLEANHRARTFYERQGWLQIPLARKYETIGGVPVAEVAYERLLAR